MSTEHWWNTERGNSK